MKNGFSTFSETGWKKTRKVSEAGMTETDKLLVRIGTARDAISRKTEQTSLDYMIDGVLMNCSVMLKEQEPIKPKSKSRHGSTTMYQHFCGNCMAMLHGKPKYCPNCGSSVKWE